MRKSILVAGLLALLGAAAGADEVQLVNGHKLEGIVSEDPRQPGKIILEVGAGIVVLDAQQVSSVSKGPSRLQEYYSRYEQVKGSNVPKDLFDLAMWAKENRCPKFVRPLCERVIALDPDHAGARRELGHEKVGGKWMTRDEAMAAKGFLQFEGKWITAAEKELIEKKRLEERERRLAAAAERERRAEEERRRREEAEERRLREPSGPEGTPYRPDQGYFQPWPPYYYGYGGYGYGYPPYIYRPYAALPYTYYTLPKTGPRFGLYPYAVPFCPFPY